MISGVRRVAGALRGLDDAYAARIRRRPGRTMRLFALAFALVLLYALTEAADWHDYVKGGSEFMLAGLIAVAPRGIYNGQLDAWTKRHKALSGLMLVVLAGVMGFIAIPDIVADWKFALAVGLPAGCLAVFSPALRRRLVKTDEGPASEVDGDPSS
ncbi:hypothetical protein GCM10009804_65660 [Kribbella hippodromi]|uniref:Uncharacterized protein n=1 Tax=Kribbella hippodromi TaxID=434347 RepID=A0ABN2EA19_9ACTN